MPIAKCRHAVETGEIRLRRSHFGKPQILEAEIGRQQRLTMASEQWASFRDVGPLRKAWPPEVVVLSNRVELRQIERDDLVHRGAPVSDGTHRVSTNQIPVRPRLAVTKFSRAKPASRICASMSSRVRS